MRYHNMTSNQSTANASCARFCANVCSQFSSGREQCFLDCMACRGAQATEAAHGCITVTSADTDSCSSDD
ncbi:MAG TPA: hypothetical protein VFK33_07670 [Bacillales bacterium]|nr:hypothetical protein [Bacillales bacterium]